jgi:2-oxo-4-hydroxy-4-carboxy-5-ureidoimidazoline decarboxylase
MTRLDFIHRYGPLFEHSPWVAERAYDVPGDDLLTRFATVLETATETERLALIRAHPELAAKIELTDSSAAEQQGAGLRALSEPEFLNFRGLNAAYREKFGFPFVICVKENTKSSIIAAAAKRLRNDPAVEQRAAIAEILKIAKFRLEALP